MLYHSKVVTSVKRCYNEVWMCLMWQKVTVTITKNHLVLALFAISIIVFISLYNTTKEDKLKVYLLNKKIQIIVKTLNQPKKKMFQIPVDLLRKDCILPDQQQTQCSRSAEERGKGQKVIAYSLYGKLNMKYFKGLEENLQDLEVIFQLENNTFKFSIQLFYSSWIIRLYINVDHLDEETLGMICHLACVYKDRQVKA